MTQLANLEAKLDVNSASFVSGMKRAADATERTANAVDRGMASMKRSVAGLGGLIAAEKVMEGAREYLRLADASKQMAAQLKLATAQFGNMGVAQNDVNRLARETHSGLTEITSLYGKMLPAANNLGKGQTEAARATETFTKALKIGGAGTNEAASATLQFGQALASGVLRGDEFNSINEASPRIMRLLAESMGVPVGALRKMAEEGKLTSDVLFKALTDPKFTATIDREFKELPLTFGDAIVQAQNAATQMVGAFDKGSGISTAISESISEGTETLAHLVNKAEESGQDIRADFAALYDVFSPMLAGGNSMFDMLGARTASFADQVRSILSGIDQVRNFLPNLQNAANKWDREHLGDTIYTRGLKDAPTSNLEGQFNARHARYKHSSARERIIGSINQYEPGYDTKGKSDAQLIAKANDVAGKVRKGEYTAKGSGKNLTPPQAGKKKPTKKGKDPAKEAEREAEKQRRDLESFTRDIDRLQSHELDSRAALATTASERFAFEREALEQDRKTEADRINKDGPQGSKRYNQAQVDQLKALNDKIAANKAEAVNLREAQFNSEEELKLKQSSLTNAQDVAQLQSSMARTAKDRRAAELRILDLQMEQERLALEAIIASRDSTDADKEIAKARLRMLPALRAAQGKQVEQQTQGPLQAYLDAIPRTKDEINEALEGVSVDGLQSLESGLVDAVRGVGSLGDAFGKLADTVISDLARIAIQQMIIKPLGSLLFGGQDSGGGGLFGSLLKGFTSAVIGGATGGLTGGITAPSMSIPTSPILAPGMITPNLSGFRANGGYTAPGTYMVGERGPELVEIGQQANVVPAHKTKAMMGSNAAPAVNVTFGSITSNDPAAVKAMTMEAIAQSMPIIVSQAKGATYRDANRPKLR